MHEKLFDLILFTVVKLRFKVAIMNDSQLHSGVHPIAKYCKVLLPRFY